LAEEAAVYVRLSKEGQDVYLSDSDQFKGLALGDLTAAQEDRAQAQRLRGQPRPH
jgi:hypothetical protein